MRLFGLSSRFNMLAFLEEAISEHAFYAEQRIFATPPQEIAAGAIMLVAKLARKAGYAQHLMFLGCIPNFVKDEEQAVHELREVYRAHAALTAITQEYNDKIEAVHVRGEKEIHEIDFTQSPDTYEARIQEILKSTSAEALLAAKDRAAKMATIIINNNPAKPVTTYHNEKIGSGTEAEPSTSVNPPRPVTSFGGLESEEPTTDGEPSRTIN